MTPQYFAGIIDGDGCISIVKSGRSLTILVAVAMTDKRVPEIMHQLYGGRLTSILRKNNHKDVWVWRVENQKAEDFLRDIQTYLIVKSEQCSLALSFRSHLREFGGLSRGSYRDAERDSQIVEFRNGLKQRMHQLNKRGRS